VIQQPYPILEFDPAPEAVIEPRRHIAAIDAPEQCVICFFMEVIEQVVKEHNGRVIKEARWEDGMHYLYEIDIDGKRLAVMNPGVGGPIAAGLLEWAIALGCRTFIACGGAGVLDRAITVGHLVVPTSAVRDEGTSYHYLPPGREVAASERGVAAIEATLQAHHVPYLLGKTWTTDAPYRETTGKVQLRKAEGCLTVDMEAASFFAVAQFRGVTLAQILYGGDDVSSEQWDNRDWVKHSVRTQLFHLAAEACLRIEEAT
jgi:uridine phosphorylase